LDCQSNELIETVELAGPREFAARALERDAKSLMQIGAALKRIDDGLYPMIHRTVVLMYVLSAAASAGHAEVTLENGYSQMYNFQFEDAHGVRPPSPETQRLTLDQLKSAEQQAREDFRRRLNDLAEHVRKADRRNASQPREASHDRLRPDYCRTVRVARHRRCIVKEAEMKAIAEHVAVQIEFGRAILRAIRATRYETPVEHQLRTVVAHKRAA
jgi:hypothetical protein